MKNKVISMTLLTIAMMVLSGCGANNNEKKIALAQCLTEKGAIMYGTNRCSHCNNQKEAFGYEAFAKIKFVDCDRNKNTCDLAGVEGFPTWIFADKTRLPGEQTMESLAQTAGCEYMTSDTTTNTTSSPTPAITANTGS